MIIGKLRTSLGQKRIRIFKSALFQILQFGFDIQPLAVGIQPLTVSKYKTCCISIDKPTNSDKKLISFEKPTHITSDKKLINFDKTTDKPEIKKQFGTNFISDFKKSNTNVKIKIENVINKQGTSSLQNKK